jgi:hypothetical protein
MNKRRKWQHFCRFCLEGILPSLLFIGLQTEEIQIRDSITFVFFTYKFNFAPGFSLAIIITTSTRL